MPIREEYERRIAEFDHLGLIDLLNQVEALDTPDWPRGMAMEYLLLRAFQLEGATVRFPFEVYLEGHVIEQIDGVVHAASLSAIVETKDQEDRVNVEPIAKLRNQLLRRPGHTVGMIFSRSGFTDPALTLAQFLSPQTILIWQGDEIAMAIRTKRLIEGMQLKHRYAAETGLAEYNLLKGMIR